MSEIFGSPGANDPTARIERQISKKADEHNADLLRAANILNRPIGSKVDLPKEDQLFDWAFKQGEGAEQFAQEVMQRASVVGPERTKLEVYEWDQKMRKLAEEQNGGS